MNAVRSTYGFAFPPELESFAEFWERHAALCECLEVGAVGPLAVFAGTSEKGFDPGGGWPRFYSDPPELFTVLVGHTDGLHWGYWFDDPNDRECDPVVAGYFHNGTYEMTIHACLFEALRDNLELFHRDAVDYAVDDPDHADDYKARLEAYARLREAMGEYDLGDRDEVGEAYIERYRSSTSTGRHVVAETRSHMGIVVPPDKYRPLAKTDRSLSADFATTTDEVDALVVAARAAAAEGFPGSALKLGHDLWAFDAHAEASRAMLDLAYESLGRRILRDYLARAVAFRARCDRERRQRAGATNA